MRLWEDIAYMVVTSADRDLSDQKLIKTERFGGKRKKANGKIG